MGEASNDVRYRVLESWCLAHTNEKHSLQQAADNLTQILNDHVNGFVCIYVISDESSSRFRKTILVHYVR